MNYEEKYIKYKGSINVDHFMADLIINDDVWNKWKGKMPVIYNRVSLK